MPEKPNVLDIDNLSDKAIEKLKTVQRKKFESSGFIKGDDLKQVNRGWESSVDIDVFPEEFPDDAIEFHTHPASKPTKEDWQSDEEFKCEIEANETLSKMLSYQDVINHVLRRKPVGMKSIMVSDKEMIQYSIKNADLFKKWINSIKSLFGDRYSESAVAEEFAKVFNRMYEEETAKFYDKKQDFSMCADKDVYEKVSARWHKFLEGIGMELKLRNI